MNNPSIRKMINESIPFARRYTEMLNSVFAVLAFSFGLACVSTENPRFYAWISFIFIIITWNVARQPYRRRLHWLQIAEHPVMGLLPVLKRSVPFVFGWLFLGLVMLGALNKNGWVGFNFN